MVRAYYRQKEDKERGQKGGRKDEGSKSEEETKVIPEASSYKPRWHKAGGLRAGARAGSSRGGGRSRAGATAGSFSTVEAGYGMLLDSGTAGEYTGFDRSEFRRNSGIPGIPGTVYGILGDGE